MPKALMIDPAEMRSRRVLEFKPIPLNQYNRSVTDELAAGTVTKADLVRIQRDMMIIRAFEEMLDSVKKQGHFKDIPYNHRGPAHLSIGQEAAAVGQAYLLDADDHIFGSHRSHGEILAKSLSAIHKLNDQALMSIMSNYFGGDCLRVVEKGAKGSTQDLAIDFIVYGALAEIFARDTGVNRGFGGSMHAFFPPFGVYPNNAIVGGSADIAVGAALFKHVNQRPRHRDRQHRRRVGRLRPDLGSALLRHDGPIQGAVGRSASRRPAADHEFRQQFLRHGRAAGRRDDGLQDPGPDGRRPHARPNARRARRRLQSAGGGRRDPPQARRHRTRRRAGAAGHGDVSLQRSFAVGRQLLPREERSRSLAGGRSAHHVCGQHRRRRRLHSGRPRRDAGPHRRDHSAARTARRSIWRSRRGPTRRTSAASWKRPCFRTRAWKSWPTASREVNHPLAENPRVQQLAKRSRSGLDEAGQPIPKQRTIGIRDALFEAIVDRFYADPTLIAYGEENRDWGGAFAVYRGLTEALPYHRLFNSPISEGAIVGTAVGYALEGGRALVELMYCDFMGRAGDEIFNQLAKWQSMSGGLLKMPVVLRVSVGSKYGAQHSQDWCSMCAHIPGLKVVFPATPYDAKGLMYSALLGTDPVIFFESQRIYDQPELFHPGGVPVGGV